MKLLLGIWDFCVCICVCNVILSVLSSFAITLLRKRELVALLYVLTCCDMWLSGFTVSFPRGAVGWSVVCDCGILWSHTLALFCTCFNPFMWNVFSHPYQLDESISNFRVVGLYFHFYPNLTKHSVSKQWRT